MQFLVRTFIKDYQQVQNKKVREAYSVLSGLTGIVCNIFLFLAKGAVGIFTGSVAILADAFNNLTDCGSALVSILGAKMSNRQPDKEHPFGHGRFEYISSLIVSFLILLVGVELFKSSVDKILHPAPVSVRLYQLIILLSAILVKLWLYAFNRKMGKTIHSTVLLATAQDSLNDSVATAATILSAVLGLYTDLPVDGIVGVLVSVFIFYGGYTLAKDTIGILLGNPASEETIRQITDIVLSADGIIGMHDLIVHDYGPGRTMASVHAEVSDKADIVAIHEVIDALENRIQAEMDMHIVIHMDPISTDNETVNDLRALLTETIARLDKRLSYHDLRITPGENNRNILLDVVIPCEYKAEKQTYLAEKIKAVLLAHDPNAVVHIKIDNI